MSKHLPITLARVALASLLLPCALATESLAKAIEGLAELDTSALRATDIRSLAETAERAARMFELLEGRATNRSDDMTRSKLDDLMNEMRDELEQSLKRYRTIH